MEGKCNGVNNSLIQFQEMMEVVLLPVRDVADVYINDIIVGTRVSPGEDAFVKHDADLRRVLEVLKRITYSPTRKSVNCSCPKLNSVVTYWVAGFVSLPLENCAL